MYKEVIRKLMHTRNRSIKCFARAAAFVLHGQFLSRIAVFHSELSQNVRIYLVIIVH